MSTVPVRRIDTQEQLIEQRREAERECAAEVTRVAALVAELDGQIEATSERRRREKMQRQPRPEELAACDAETARLKIAREAVHDALRHANRRADDVRQHRVDAEAQLRGLYDRVRYLRGALPNARLRIAQTAQQLSQAEHDVKLIRARQAADIAAVENAEREIEEIIGTPESIEPAPASTTSSGYSRWFAQFMNG